ncbi:MAG: cyclic nucleotide-binding domain-containing protein, partial [Thermodesulfobacteriota bacterium]|nr:cyclic nucleotide-binding domain-containing protein [Thermodesulfobacteriota bacterium]
EQGDQENAAKLLFDMITKLAREKKFAKAEQLRGKLYEVAPMALNEIIKSGEIIEEEKTQTIDEDYLQTWSGLVDRLSPDELNSLYFSMESKSLKAGQVVFKQGQTDSRLYFIQKGRLQMLYQDPSEEKEVLLKELTPGAIANNSAFFSFTVCTTSLIAVTESEVSFLEQYILSKWKDNFPGIESKLNSFCNSFESISDVVQKVGVNLRTSKRVKTSINAIVQLLDKSGKPLKRPFKVFLSDIAEGGVCYKFKLNKREEAKQLLEHQLNLQAIYKSSKGREKLDCNGRIVAVHIHPFDESTVHVQFEKPLDEEIVMNIGRMIRPPG